MGPRKASYFEMFRHSAAGLLKGKIEAPDGLPLFQIDGPHSAPTQHLGEYSTVMIIGGGIGVTPVSSTLKSVVLHRWKNAIGAVFPQNAYFYWVISYRDLDCFRWLVRYIKDVEDEMYHMRAQAPAVMATKRFEFHVWVTSVPEPTPSVTVEADDECSLWGVPDNDTVVEREHRAPFDAAQLYCAMKCPDRHTVLGDVHIHKGRPDWSPAFRRVSENHPVGDVGVMFCGHPAIANDLAANCFKVSHKRRNGTFRFHKENF